jgi:arylsulfatase A-like enzyme
MDSSEATPINGIRLCMKTLDRLSRISETPLTYLTAIWRTKRSLGCGCSQALAPNKPWLLYYATGTAHAPHHAPKDWIAKYKGQFDQGWDKVREETLARQIKLGVVPPNTQLTKRPEQLPAWDSLSPDQKRLYARMMEVYAGALSYADNQIGRLLDAVQESGQLAPIIRESWRLAT